MHDAPEDVKAFLFTAHPAYVQDAYWSLGHSTPESKRNQCFNGFLINLGLMERFERSGCEVFSGQRERTKK